jgi:hypothetical protein
MGAAQGLAGVIGGGCGGSPRAKRMRSTGADSVMKAIRRMSAPQLGQTSGSDANSRACSDRRSMTQR